MVARARAACSLAVLAATIDNSVFVTGFAMATCHEARWALHDHLVRILIARRVPYLLAEGDGPFGALAFAKNVQHYQHLLVYELRHVIPVGTRRKTYRRRLDSSSAVAAVTAGAIIAPPAAASPSTPRHAELNASNASALVANCRGP